MYLNKAIMLKNLMEAMAGSVSNCELFIQKKKSSGINKSPYYPTSEQNMRELTVAKWKNSTVTYF